MAQVRRRRGRIEIRLDARERAAVLDLIERLSPHVGSAPGGRPPVYEDPDRQGEYERWTRPHVDEGRTADIEAVRRALRGEEDTTAVSEERAVTWLRALNHLRLAAAGILGIDEDGWERDADPGMRSQLEFGALIALGYLQEELVEALSS